MYDPCWTDKDYNGVPAVLCQAKPWEDTATLLNVSQPGGLSPFYTASESLVDRPVWGLELSNGERCIAEQGAHSSFDAHIVNYACETATGQPDERMLLGEPDRTRPAWTIESASYDAVTNSYSPGPVVAIMKAWTAIPDEGDEREAAVNACTVDALAYSGRQYEAANHEPDGPLPSLARHACSGGYAVIAVQKQEPSSTAPEVMLAFRATPTGWTFTGRAIDDPGELDIPTEIYARLQPELLQGAPTGVSF